MDEVLELYASKFNVGRPNYKELYLGKVIRTDREPRTEGYSDHYTASSEWDIDPNYTCI